MGDILQNFTSGGAAVKILTTGTVTVRGALKTSHVALIHAPNIVLVPGAPVTTHGALAFVATGTTGSIDIGANTRAQAKGAASYIEFTAQRVYVGEHVQLIGCYIDGVNVTTTTFTVGTVSRR